MKRIMIQYLVMALMINILVHAHIPVSAASDQGKTSSQSPGFSPFDPAPVGATVKTSIQCGEAYSSHEPYDVKITLLEVLRGEKAREHARKSGITDWPAKEGFDYLLARIRFEYSARGAPGNCGHELGREQFISYSSQGREYGSARVNPSEPELKGQVYSGESKVGWVVFLVPKEDSRPLMTFNAEPGGAIDHGGNVWFQLE